MTICSSHGIKTQEIKGKLSITLSHVQLNGLLENTQIVFTFIDGDMKPAFYFEIPRDTNRYLILGILDEAGYSHCCLLVQPKQMFNPQHHGINRNSKQLPNRMGMA